MVTVKDSVRTALIASKKEEKTDFIAERLKAPASEKTERKIIINERQEIITVEIPTARDRESRLFDTNE